MKINFLPLLAILFIGLKLGNVIAWSWLWVLAPLWGGFAIFLLAFIVIFAIAMISGTTPRYYFKN